MTASINEQNYVMMEMTSAHDSPDPDKWVPAQAMPPDFSSCFFPPKIEVWRLFCAMMNAADSSCKYRLVRVVKVVTETREVIS